MVYSRISHTKRVGDLDIPIENLIVDLKELAGDVLWNNEIFRRVGVSKTTGYRILANKKRPKPVPKRRGRHKLITDEHIAKADSLLQGQYKNQEISWKQLGSLIGVEASESTIRRAFYDAGYCRSMACRKRWLTHGDMEVRLSFARAFHDLCGRELLYFSDTAHFRHRDGQYIQIIRRYEDRLCKDCSQNCSKSMPTDLHVWAAVGRNYKSPIISYKAADESGRLAQKDDINDILSPLYEPGTRVSGLSSFILLEDGDDESYGTNSSDNLVRAYKSMIGLQYMRNPARSPDLNIMPNIWSILESRLESRVFESEEEFKQGLLEEWANIEQFKINELMLTMKKRSEEAITRQGQATQFLKC